MPALKEHHKYAGMTLVQIMWSKLDDVMDELMSGKSPIKFRTGNEAAYFTAIGELRGKAQGIAQCLAIMTDPIHSTVDDVREVAMERWEARQHGRTHTHPGDGKSGISGRQLEAVVDRNRKRAVHSRIRP